MTIAIVDDELETRQYMQGLVAQYLAETGRMAQLVFYPDGASFLVGCEHPDIVLMDIDMPGMDGLSTAEQLRRSHPDAILIFTTRLSQCAIRGYEVDAIGFLVKPVTLPGLTVKLNKAFKRVEYRQSKICLKTKDSILFFKGRVLNVTVLHSCIIHIFMVVINLSANLCNVTMQKSFIRD